MNTLQFYLDGAENCIRKWGNLNMLNDEDSISHVAHYMMKADERFDGRGSRYGYRAKCAKFAIMDLIYKPKSKKRKGSVNVGDDYLNDLARDIGDIEKIDIRDLLNSELLTEKESNYLNLYYLHNMNLREIGEKYKVSRESVRQRLKRSLEKLRGIFNVVE